MQVLLWCRRLFLRVKCVSVCFSVSPCGSHLELDHGAEVVVPEEDAELALLHGGRELTEAVVRQLSGRVVQELLGHDAWHQKEKCETRGKKSPELWTEMEMAKNRRERIRTNHGGL